MKLKRPWNIIITIVICIIPYSIIAALIMYTIKNNKDKEEKYNRIVISARQSCIDLNNEYNTIYTEVYKQYISGSNEYEYTVTCLQSLFSPLLWINKSLIIDCNLYENGNIITTVKNGKSMPVEILPDSVKIDLSSKHDINNKKSIVDFARSSTISFNNKYATMLDDLYLQSCFNEDYRVTYMILLDMMEKILNLNKSLLIDCRVYDDGIEEMISSEGKETSLEFPPRELKILE